MVDDRRRGWALAAIGMLLVSTDSYFIRRADFDAWTIAFVFAVASTISLGTYALVRPRPTAGNTAGRNPPALAAVVLLSALTQLSFVGAVNNTAVSNVVVIVAATPVVTAALARLTLGERTDTRVAFAIGATVVGIVIVVSGSLGAPTLEGDLLALLAVMLVSASLVLWRRFPALDRPTALALSSATMAAITAPLADITAAPTRVFVAAGLMGLLFNPLGRLAYTTAPRYAPTAEVALFAPVETVAATVWAWLFFSEQPSVVTVVGGVVVVGAVLWGTVGRQSGRGHEVAALPDE